MSRSPVTITAGLGHGVSADTGADDLADEEFDPAAVRARQPRAASRGGGVQESAGAAEVVRALNRRRGVRCRKNHGTAAGGRGEPDLDGSIVLAVTGWPFGRAFKIEMKRPGDGDGPRPDQARRLVAWQDAGALVGWATNMTEVDEILDRAADPDYRWSLGDGPGAPVAD